MNKTNFTKFLSYFYDLTKGFSPLSIWRGIDVISFTFFYSFSILFTENALGQKTRMQAIPVPNPPAKGR